MKRLRLLSTTAACRTWSSRLTAGSVLVSFTTTLLAPSFAFARDADPASSPELKPPTAPLRRIPEWMTSHGSRWFFAPAAV